MQVIIRLTCFSSQFLPRQSLAKHSLHLSHIQEFSYRSSHRTGMHSASRQSVLRRFGGSVAQRSTATSNTSTRAITSGVAFASPSYRSAASCDRALFQRLERTQQRTFFNIFRSSDRPPPPPPPPQPLYSQDDLFHVLDQSPVMQMQQRARSIKSLAPCPTCLDHAQTSETATPEPTPILKVSHSCSECGFPTHCSEGHYIEGKAAHDEYCSRLREINEDEHDLRSGRLITEFELPGECLLRARVRRVFDVGRDYIRTDRKGSLNRRTRL